MTQYEIFRLDISKYNVQLTFQDEEFESGCIGWRYAENGKEHKGNGFSKTKLQLTRIAQVTSKSENVIVPLIKDVYSGSNDSIGTYIVRSGSKISGIIFYDNSNTTKYIEILDDTNVEFCKSLNNYFGFQNEEFTFYYLLKGIFKEMNCPFKRKNKTDENVYCYYMNY